MRYLIVTQTYPPRTGGMQNVMHAITTKLSSINETHVFPDRTYNPKRIIGAKRIFVAILKIGFLSIFHNFFLRFYFI